MKDRSDEASRQKNRRAKRKALRGVSTHTAPCILFMVSDDPNKPGWRNHLSQHSF